LGHSYLSFADFVVIEGDNFKFERGDNVLVDIATGFDSPEDVPSSIQPGLDAIVENGFLDEDDYSVIEDLPAISTSIGAENVNIHVGGATSDNALFSFEDIDIGLNFIQSSKIADPSSVIPNMFALKTFIPDPIDVSWDGFVFDIDELSIGLNKGSQWVSDDKTSPSPNVNYQTSFQNGGIEVTGGDNPIFIDYDSPVLAIDIGHALLHIFDFIHIEGGFTLQTGAELSVSGSTGLPLVVSTDLNLDLLDLKQQGIVSIDHSSFTDLPVSSMMIGAQDVNVFVGYGPYFIDSNNDGIINESDTPGADAMGFAMGNLDIGLLILDPTESVDPKNIIPNMYALKVSTGDIGIKGMDFLTLSAEKVVLELNQGASWAEGDEWIPSVDFKASFPDTQGYVVNEEVTIDFEVLSIGVKLTNAQIQLAEFVHISGDFAFDKGSTVVVTVNAGLLGDISGIEVETMNVGAKNVQAFVGVNGPYRSDTNNDGVVDESDDINDSAVGFLIDDLDLGMTLMAPTMTIPGLAEQPNMAALKASANSVAFKGFSDDIVKLEVNELVVELNLASQGLYVNFAKSFEAEGDEPAGYKVETGGEPVYLDFDSEMIRATTGLATMILADFVYLRGGFAFQKKHEENATFKIPGLDFEAPAEVLTVAGSNVYAFAGLNGPYLDDTNNDGIIDDNDDVNDDAVGIHIADLNFALAMMTPSLGAGPAGQAPGDLKFFGFKGKVGQAGLVGAEPYLNLAQVRQN